MTNHCNQSASGVPVEHLEDPTHSPVYLQPVLCHLCKNLVRHELSRLQLEIFFPSVPSTGGSEDPGWTLTFLIEPFGCVVAPPLFNNRAEGKVTAREHSVGGATLDTCGCVQDDAFVVHRCKPKQYNGWPHDHWSPGPFPIPHQGMRKMLLSTRV